MTLKSPYVATTEKIFSIALVDKIGTATVGSGTGCAKAPEGKMPEVHHKRRSLMVFISRLLLLQRSFGVMLKRAYGAAVKF